MIIPRNQPTSHACNLTPPTFFSDPHRRNKIDLYKCMDTDFAPGEDTDTHFFWGRGYRKISPGGRGHVKTEQVKSW